MAGGCAKKHFWLKPCPSVSLSAVGALLTKQRVLRASKRRNDVSELSSYLLKECRRKSRDFYFRPGAFVANTHG